MSLVIPFLLEFKYLLIFEREDVNVQFFLTSKSIHEQSRIQFLK